MWAYEATRTGLAPEIIELWNENDPNRWEVASLPGEPMRRSSLVRLLMPTCPA